MIGIVSAAELKRRITEADFSRHAVFVAGYGNMGRQFVQAMQRLGVGGVRVGSRREEPVSGLREQGVPVITGDYAQWDGAALDGEVAVVALPISQLEDAVRRLAGSGFQRILIEKPVSLHANRIEDLADTLESLGVEAFCAYNRIAYPVFAELRHRAASEGGITSFHYGLTELIERIRISDFDRESLMRWGVANSLHVIAMAHGLGGMPGEWSAYRSGNAVPWHPSGSVFVGAGLSSGKVPFAYHADWGSAGRWWIEAHTPGSSYRLCPLEELFRKSSATGDWEQIPVETFAPDLKTGFAEQVAAVLDDDIRSLIPLVSLRQAAELTRFAEQVFGYSPE